jgi:hypothetical protein
MSNSIKFSDIKDEIEKVLKERINLLPTENDNFSLVEGFGQLPVLPGTHQDMMYAFIPTVSIVSNLTGQIYTYALKAILPELEILMKLKKYAQIVNLSLFG